jgi:hypothetical protein
MSEAASPTRDQISAAIAEKAWKDEAFHRAILADPNKLYEEHFGQPVPAGLKIKVLEDTADTVHFVIPARPAKTGELSDAELEDVAGGVTPTLIIGPIALSLFSVAGSAAIGYNNEQRASGGGW